jgi:fructosamine-3-kinase
MWDKIAAHISETTGETFSLDNRHSVSGGCINQGYSISSSSRAYFAKINQASQIAMFEAEALGLQQMRATQTIRVPEPICWGTEGNSAYIVLEWLDLGSRGGERAWEEMGRKLAAMHKYTPPNPPLARGGEEHNSTLLRGEKSVILPCFGRFLVGILIIRSAQLCKLIIGRQIGQNFGQNIGLVIS